MLTVEFYISQDTTDEELTKSFDLGMDFSNTPESVLEKNPKQVPETNKGSRGKREAKLRME